MRRRARLLSLRAVLLVGVVLVAAPGALFLSEPESASAQQLGEGMKRTGTVGIANETEKRLFESLICTCGCPRETLGTCTCDTAHARRDELRGLLETGKGVEEIQDLYAKRYGMAGLAVPPNRGIGRALWAVPVVAILIGAGAVLIALRKWKARGDGPPPGSPGGGDGAGPGGKSGKRDEYDDRLDRELEELDR